MPDTGPLLSRVIDESPNLRHITTFTHRVPWDPRVTLVGKCAVRMRGSGEGKTAYIYKCTHT